MQNILLGYDGSEASQRALERAASLTKAFGSNLTVTSVVPVEPARGGIDPTQTPATQAAEAAKAREYLETEGIEAAYQGIAGDPADALIELASERGVDLIVVGTRNLGAIQRLFGQSVSATVAQKARCDVLVVH
jgi:nucleotide-binding universal stress UspA family protein